MIEVSQPADLVDGIDSARPVAGRVVGIAENPGDRIDSIALNGADVRDSNTTLRNFPLVRSRDLCSSQHPEATAMGTMTRPETRPCRAFRLLCRMHLGETVAQTVTGSDGAYHFEQVAVGTYAIVGNDTGGFDRRLLACWDDRRCEVGTSIDGGLIRRHHHDAGRRGRGLQLL